MLYTRLQQSPVDHDGLPAGPAQEAQEAQQAQGPWRGRSVLRWGGSRAAGLVVAVGADVPLRSSRNRLRSADQHVCAFCGMLALPSRPGFADGLIRGSGCHVSRDDRQDDQEGDDRADHQADVDVVRGRGDRGAQIAGRRAEAACPANGGADPPLTLRGRYARSGAGTARSLAPRVALKIAPKTAAPTLWVVCPLQYRGYRF